MISLLVILSAPGGVCIWATSLCMTPLEIWSWCRSNLKRITNWRATWNYSPISCSRRIANSTARSRRPIGKDLRSGHFLIVWRILAAVLVRLFLVMRLREIRDFSFGGPLRRSPSDGNWRKWIYKGIRYREMGGPTFHWRRRKTEIFPEISRNWNSLRWNYPNLISPVDLWKFRRERYSRMLIRLGKTSARDGKYLRLWIKDHHVFTVGCFTRCFLFRWRASSGIHDRYQRKSMIALLFYSPG